MWFLAIFQDFLLKLVWQLVMYDITAYNILDRQVILWSDTVTNRVYVQVLVVYYVGDGIMFSQNIIILHKVWR